MQEFNFGQTGGGLPVAQCQTHVATPISHEGVEIVDDILLGTKVHQD